MRRLKHSCSTVKVSGVGHEQEGREQLVTRVQTGWCVGGVKALGHWVVGIQAIYRPERLTPRRQRREAEPRITENVLEIPDTVAIGAKRGKGRGLPMQVCVSTHSLRICPWGCGRRWCCTRRAAWSRGLSQSRPEDICSSFPFRPLSDWAAPKKKKNSFSGIPQRVQWLRRGPSPSFCKHSIHALSCYREWQGVNVGIHWNVTVWQKNIEKRKVPGTET